MLTVSLSRYGLRAARRIPSKSIRNQHTAHTLLHPTPESLTAHLSAHPPSASSPLLYLLSTSIPSSQLFRLLPTLQSIPNSIGSFQTSPPGSAPTLSLATFDNGKIVRTGVTGRPQAEVGKWQRLRPEGEGKWGEDMKGWEEGDLANRRSEGGWEDVWRAELKVDRILELEGLNAQSMVLVTDGTPNPLLRSLEGMYPDSSRIGLVSAPTPFITSRPHTLFHNTQTYSSGAIGISLPARLSTEVRYPLKPLTDRMNITSARGNMLLKIDGKNENPTQTLILALQSRGSKMTKEEDFYMAFMDGNNIRKVVKILSGDPSRGALALETEAPLSVGQEIQYMYRDSSVALPDPRKSTISFSALTRNEYRDEEVADGEPRTVDGFLGFSEDGFIVDDGVCNVPFATASWSV